MYLDSYNKKNSELCKKHKVRHLFAFGSVLTNKFSDIRDIDLIVDINSTDSIIYAENYFEFELEDLLKRKIYLKKKL